MGRQLQLEGQHSSFACIFGKCTNRFKAHILQQQYGWRKFTVTVCTLQTHAAPEVLRAPLEGLCLTVKSATGPSATSTHEQGADHGTPVKLQEMLARLLTPPPPVSVAAAVSNLKGLGALDPESEALTPLGQLLCQLPMDPRLGKTLLFGAMLG